MVTSTRSGKRAIVLSLVPTAALLLGACKTREFNSESKQLSDGAASAESPTKVSFKVKADVKTYLKEKTDAASSKENKTCPLTPDTTYTIDPDFGFSAGHYKVTITSGDFECPFQTGYVFAQHVVMSDTGSPLCKYSWEEKPGWTDYTTYDVYNRRTYPDPLVPAAQTLLGKVTLSSRGPVASNDTHLNRSLCEKARYLRSCFVRTVLEADNTAARKFRGWAQRRNINPMIALMAKTQQETKMGSIVDSCQGRNCNGIGIGQIITAVDENGRRISDSDERWIGITHNILTNLTFAVRVVAEKVDVSRDLYNLAYNYNGSPNATFYAGQVTKYYNQLSSCGL